MSSPGAQSVILAVDVGTSSARAVLFDTHAQYLAQVSQAYEMRYPRPGWNEQSPVTVFSAVLGVLKQAVTSLSAMSRLEGVVFSAQMYSVLAVDSDGAPLSNSLTWGDTRSADTAAHLRRSASPDLAIRTGCPLQPIYPLAKIAWMRANLPLPAQARFVSIKDYVIYRLTGAWACDLSTASATGLLHIARRDWDAEALALCGITPQDLPPLVSPRHALRYWRPEIAAQIGIPADLPLVVGAGDAPLANIGVGATEPGTLAVNLGTSAAARVLVNTLQVDPEGQLWTYIADEAYWTMGGIIGSGGAVYEWLLRDVLFKGQERPAAALFQEADRLADSVSPGAEGLLFVPFLSGEQSTGWNARMRGALFGLTLGQEARHQIRAVMEGVAFSLRRVARRIETCQRTAMAIQKIYLTGGLAASPIWQQVIADVFGVPVIVPPSPESSARGAAVLGWLALGQASAYAPFAQPESPRVPIPAHSALYEARYAAFVLLIDHLKQFLADQANQEETND